MENCVCSTEFIAVLRLRMEKYNQKHGAATFFGTEDIVRNYILHMTTTHCNTLNHTATHCNTLQHTATHCNTFLTMTSVKALHIGHVCVSEFIPVLRLRIEKYKRKCRGAQRPTGKYMFLV